jgi:hypothetical protein
VHDGQVTDEHEQIRADQVLLERAATRLRTRAIQGAYADLARREVAFGLAAVLDELRLHLRDLDPAVRDQTVRSCRVLLGEPGDSVKGP